MTTIYAHSTRNTYERFAGKSLSEARPVVVHMKQRKDGKRVVDSIAEIRSISGANFEVGQLFEFDEGASQAIRTNPHKPSPAPSLP